MDHYEGVSPTDVPSGGGSYVKDTGFGHEAFNFAPCDGEYFGYVQATGNGVNLGRLGCDPGAESLDGVSVVWECLKTLQVKGDGPDPCNDDGS